ncbi:lactosylceramide 4-alpha-galactosyltransferase-like [Daphnia carinata]|uniref:lactosylceramide 4-alpha-galactosyltransferase-like n=1 Tax=Daphnia carinata TaxID=120202 RepID=UPI00258095E8|nr:lactosylceramide 4-alpha-galactosyltransferase-like [Daphnia carinata]
MSIKVRFWRFVKRNVGHLNCNGGDPTSLADNQQNSTGRVTSRRLTKMVVCLLPMPLLVLLFSTAKDQSAITQISHTAKILCVNSKLAVDPPIADGLIMQKDVRASEWKTFNSTSQKGLTDQRIFFHETSGTNELNFRQCCAVESAAKNNPDRPVQLFLRPLFISCHEHLSSHPSDFFHKPLWLDILSNYPNIEAILLNEDYYFAGTPLQSWYNAGKWRKTEHETVHFSDYIRFLTMHKGGGLYLDMDVLTLRPFQGDKFRNFLSYDGVAMKAVSSSVMHLEVGHWLATGMMRLLAEEYDPLDLGFHGSQAVGSLMHSSCALVRGNPESNTCKDIHLLPSNFFLPFGKMFAEKVNNWRAKSLKGSGVLTKLKNSYGVHTWKSVGNNPADLSNNPSVFGALAQIHCPISVARASEFQN